MRMIAYEYEKMRVFNRDEDDDDDDNDEKHIMTTNSVFTHSGSTYNKHTQ